MRSNPYLMFDGRCAEAFAAYARILGGEITVVQTHGAAQGDAAPAGWGDKIMHSELRFGENLLMGSDAPPDWYEAPRGMSVALILDSVDDGRGIFEALAEEGAVRLDFQEVPWAKGFGMLTDRWGIPWMISAGPP